MKKVLPLGPKLAAKYRLEFFSPGGGLGIVYNPALASGSPAWWKTAGGEGDSDAGELRAKLAAAAAAAGLENLDRAGPVHRRQRRAFS